MKFSLQKVGKIQFDLVEQFEKDQTQIPEVYFQLSCYLY